MTTPTAAETKETARLATKHAHWHCSSGGAHEWVYRRDTLQHYRCLKCGFVTTKSELKAATDSED